MKLAMERKNLPAFGMSGQTKAAKEFSKALMSIDGIMNPLIEILTNKPSKELAKTDGKKSETIFVPKLDDAVYAGTRNAEMCSLYLTEGDSAKTLAMEGI